MIAELVSANLAAHPGRRRDFDRLRGGVSIEAVDAAVAVTLSFGGGRLVVHPDVHGQPLVRVTANAATVLELSSLPIVVGIPWLFGRRGRSLLVRLLRGEVKITGLRHAATLVRLTRLLSVA
jgi:hypothetical protein